MPRRNDIHRILILGSGPIVIGQAAEFDYSGVQACKVLREEGYEVILINSNPATIMTDPELADATYIEPLLPGPAAQVIERERPDALLPTLGGQTALNLAKALHDDGTLERHGVELIGANYEAIACAEDRQLFGEAMASAGLRMPASAIATGWDAELGRVDVKRGLAEALDALPDIGLPCIVRPAYTLGGRGGGIARTAEEFRAIVARGVEASPIGQVLLDQSVLGWGEFELEVMRDKADNVVIVCSIENVDPMGVHTGDSVTVAPQQTLPDRLYQRLRDQALTVIRAVGVETGGSNVQFAVNPTTEEVLVIEMNPRVSRSSALASKATGFPIAKIAARLAVGYLLEEIPNDITRLTPACFEPTIDYVVVKWPRFAFEKFPGTESTLSTHMKSVGEAMAIGRTFGQAFAKALRSRELDKTPRLDGVADKQLLESVSVPGPDRFEAILELFRRGVEMEAVHERTAIDLWFLRELRALAKDPEAPFAGERTFKAVDTCAAEFPAQTPYYYSAWERPRASANPPAGGGGVEGDSAPAPGGGGVEGESAPAPDGVGADAVRLPAHEVRRGERPSVVILGAGPNRIGQGIEFDYCCVHAAITVRELGRDAVMINCNPETVSTDYDTSDRLYFEPLTLEDVLGVVEVEQPEGVIVQFGGQTPLKLAAGLAAAGVPLLGTSVEAIDLAEDRGRFGELLGRLGYQAPPYATASSVEEALRRVEEVGFPLLVRPSYVLGGRAMEIVYSREGLADYLRRELPPLDSQNVAHPPPLGGANPPPNRGANPPPSRGANSPPSRGANSPPNSSRATGLGGGTTIFLDRFLENAIEVDVDALCDGREVWIGGIMQHVEEAGVHSGDSACVLPPHSLGGEMLDQIRAATRELALNIGVVGLLNVQYAVVDGQLYVLEANPRASRTVPFVSKAVGLPLAKLACRVMLGETIASLRLPREREGLGFGNHVSVKEAVLPFDRFEGADAVLGPEMRSTGEVMGIARDFPTAFAKAQAAAGCPLPLRGTVFISVTDADKAGAFAIAQSLHDNGFRILATRGTAEAIARMGIPTQALNKVSEGSPHVLDWIERGDVDLVVNTPTGSGARTDGWRIRRAAVTRGIPCLTTLAAGVSAARAISSARQNGPPPVLCLQELHRGREASEAGVA
jgi:carbamoyl-phosphate synthase large subunit